MRRCEAPLVRQGLSQASYWTVRVVAMVREVAMVAARTSTATAAAERQAWHVASSANARAAGRTATAGCGGEGGRLGGGSGRTTT